VFNFEQGVQDYPSVGTGPIGGLCLVHAGDLAMSKPDDYRAKAEECRLQADRAFSPLDKEAWLQLAADWLAMASLRERSAIDRFN
jgi:hypothetical protein